MTTLPPLPATGAWLPGDEPGHREFFTFATDRRFALDSGVALSDVVLAYQTWGRLDADASNAVLLCHAWTGDSHAAGPAGRGHHAPGWWDDMIGPGKVLDTNRYFVVCSNVIGSCFGSTGPTSPNPRTGRPYRLSFPVLMVRDMVRAQQLLMDYLGIDRVLTVIGGSMGAMQALEWAVLYPERTRSIIPIAGSGRQSPMAISLNSVARQAIYNDPLWRKGNYKPEHPPADGLALARSIGHIAFLSDQSMHLKFGRRFSVRDGIFDFFGRFEVERYLEYNGRNFVDRFDTNSFLYLAKALDLYDVAWGFDGLSDALAGIACPSLWFAFSSDWLYPPYQTEEVVDELARQGKPVQYHLIDSDYGHDSFLVEPEKFTPKVVEFLASLAE